MQYASHSVIVSTLFVHQAENSRRQTINHRMKLAGDISQDIDAKMIAVPACRTEALTGIMWIRMITVNSNNVYNWILSSKFAVQNVSTSK